MKFKMFNHEGPILFESDFSTFSIFYKNNSLLFYKLFIITKPHNTIFGYILGKLYFAIFSFGCDFGSNISLFKSTYIIKLW